MTEEHGETFVDKRYNFFKLLWNLIVFGVLFTSANLTLNFKRLTWHLQLKNINMAQQDEW